MNVSSRHLVTTARSARIRTAVTSATASRATQAATARRYQSIIANDATVLISILNCSKWQIKQIYVIYFRSNFVSK